MKEVKYYFIYDPIPLMGYYMTFKGQKIYQKSPDPEKDKVHEINYDELKIATLENARYDFKGYYTFGKLTIVKTKDSNVKGYLIKIPSGADNIDANFMIFDYKKIRCKVKYKDKYIYAYTYIYNKAKRLEPPLQDYYNRLMTFNLFDDKLEFVLMRTLENYN